MLRPMVCSFDARALALALPLSLSLACGDDGSVAGEDTLATATDTGTGPDGASTSTTDDADSGDTGDTTAGPADTTSGDSTGSSTCLEPIEADCAPQRGVIPGELLETFLGSEDLVIVDTRPEPLFTADHLPGAVHIDPGALRAMVDGINGQVASEADSRAVFEAAGLTPDVAVVTYGSDNGTDPARVLWTLAYYGHQGPLWMLDGGYDQWTAEGRALDTDATPPTTSSYPTVVTDMLRVDQQWVLDHLDDPTVTLVDARGQGEYDGGHIPGAISVDWTRNLGDDGLFLPTDELPDLYMNPPDGQTLVSYCQTGSRASVDWLVLAWLGYADVRLYDGSWAEWSSDPGNPVE